MKRKLTVDYLLVCLTEEANEVGKVASKIYRFGQNDTPPGKSSYNKTKLAQEIGDLLGVVDMLRNQGIEIDDGIIQQARAAKPGKIMQYISREMRK